MYFYFSINLYIFTISTNKIRYNMNSVQFTFGSVILLLALYCVSTYTYCLCLRAFGIVCAWGKKALPMKMDFISLFFKNCMLREIYFVKNKLFKIF